MDRLIKFMELKLKMLLQEARQPNLDMEACSFIRGELYAFNLMNEFMSELAGPNVCHCSDCGEKVIQGYPHLCPAEDTIYQEDIDRALGPSKTDLTDEKHYPGGAVGYNTDTYYKLTQEQARAGYDAFTTLVTLLQDGALAISTSSHNDKFYDISQKLLDAKKNIRIFLGAK